MEWAWVLAGQDSGRIFKSVSWIALGMRGLSWWGPKGNRSAIFKRLSVFEWKLLRMVIIWEEEPRALCYPCSLVSIWIYRTEYSLLRYYVLFIFCYDGQLASIRADDWDSVFFKGEYRYYKLFFCWGRAASFGLSQVNNGIAKEDRWKNMQMKMSLTWFANVGSCPANRRVIQDGITMESVLDWH